METVRISLTADGWTDVSDQNHTVAFDIQSAQTVLVHMGSAATPAEDAAAFEVLSHPENWDFSISGLTSAEYVWARGKTGPVDVVVART
jgi:hypothetical protein